MESWPLCCTYHSYQSIKEPNVSGWLRHFSGAVWLFVSFLEATWAVSLCVSPWHISLLQKREEICSCLLSSTLSQSHTGHGLDEEAHFLALSCSAGFLINWEKAVDFVKPQLWFGWMLPYEETAGISGLERPQVLYNHKFWHIFSSFLRIDFLIPVLFRLTWDSQKSSADWLLCNGTS